MPETDAFWDFYWETRLQGMENLGKREAILAASKVIRRLAQNLERPVRVLELGCGEGQVVGSLVNAHSQLCAETCVVGVDINRQSLARCRKDYPHWRFIEGDFTDTALLNQLVTGHCLPGYDLLLLVNALHEVFSACISPELGVVEVPPAKEKTTAALQAAVNCLTSGGWLVLFDGLEPPGDPQEELRIRFQDDSIRQDFERFCREYRPFHITYRQSGQDVILSRRHFTRYITKSIFLRKALWQNEQKESYQYFSEIEFRAALERLDLQITELRTLTVNRDKWQNLVRICSPQFDFPEEHILILAKKL